MREASVGDGGDSSTIRNVSIRAHYPVRVTPAPPETRQGGRVRSEAARLAILEATASEFAARGYEHLTIEGIAAAAGVGKQTIYRWWRSKGDLVAEAVLEDRLLGERFHIPDTGDLRSDLESWLGAVFDMLAGPQGEGLLRSLIAAAADNADIGLRLRERIAGEGVAGGADDAASAESAEPSVTDRLRSAVTAGELPTRAPVAEIAELLVGAVILRALSRTGGDREAVARLVAAVVD
ncbi:TetR/AcrR family transcriptional regulator [Schumannella luteola]|nr:TetR/AcrR family transcriptional regulator [Schumannella luteola]TPX01338.1 TetR/AcrR family transcriptional regulator [Schumannella luteola]